MYIEHLAPKFVAVLSAPKCFIKRLFNRDLVSFGLMANLHLMAKRGVFDDVDVIIDVGANIGQFAYMMHSALPDCPIHSFEPDPKSYDKLQSTFRTKGIAGKCFPYAISDFDGKVTLNLYESSANNSTLERIGEPSQTIVTVPCKSLDSLKGTLGDFRNAYLKVDVQGAESRVLSGANNLLRQCKFVQLEISLELAHVNSSIPANIFATMQAAGFRCWEVLDILRDKKPNELGIVEMDLLFIRNASQ